VLFFSGSFVEGSYGCILLVFLNIPAPRIFGVTDVFEVLGAIVPSRMGEGSRV
jgi:hypothetical protein